ERLARVARQRGVRLRVLGGRVLPGQRVSALGGEGVLLQRLLVGRGLLEQRGPQAVETGEFVPVGVVPVLRVDFGGAGGAGLRRGAAVDAVVPGEGGAGRQHRGPIGRASGRASV